MLLDDLWFPFAEEMGELDPYNEIAENVRNDAIEHRERQFEDDDVAIVLSESDDTPGHGESTITGYAVVTASESPPIFARGREASVDTGGYKKLKNFAHPGCDSLYECIATSMRQAL